MPPTRTFPWIYCKSDFDKAALLNYSKSTNVVVRAGVGDLWDVIATKINEDQSTIVFTEIIGALAESTLPDSLPGARYDPFSGPPTWPSGDTSLSRTVQVDPYRVPRSYTPLRPILCPRQGLWRRSHSPACSLSQGSARYHPPLEIPDSGAPRLHHADGRSEAAVAAVMPFVRQLRTTLRGPERDGVYGARVVLGRDELVLYNATMEVASVLAELERSARSCPVLTRQLSPTPLTEDEDEEEHQH